MVEQDKLRTQISKLSSRTKDIQAQSAKMQSMVSKIDSTLYGTRFYISKQCCGLDMTFSYKESFVTM